MKEKDFVINSINELVKLFPTTRVRYENHQQSNTHFVEVVPSEIYKLDAAYQDWEEGILFQFINKFPNQNLCFFSDDAIVGIENVEFETKGNLYDLLYTFNRDCYQEVQEISVYQGNSIPNISQVKIGEIPAISSNVSALTYNFSSNFVNVDYEFFTPKKTIKPNIIEEHNYSLAA